MSVILPEPFKNLSMFIEYWTGIYEISNEYVECLYNKNIRKPLTEEGIRELYIWKNGMKLSDSKETSIENNYLVKTPVDDLEDRYLDHNKPGGAIWNIFYLHINSPDKYPIFDQHVHRAWCYMRPKVKEQTNMNSDKDKICAYKKYIKFHKEIENDIGNKNRKIDKALFCFGKAIKKVKRPT